MQLLIDGYNLFKSLSSGPHLSPQQIAYLTLSVERYAIQKDLAAILVFDGGPSAQLLYEHKKVLTIVHVGTYNSADDYIKQYLKAHAKSDLLLVSSDRELRLCADGLHIPSIGAADFWSIVQTVLQQKSSSVKSKNEQARKMSITENKELDLLMSQTVIPSSKKDVPFDAYWIDDKGKTYSKNEKKLIETLKKLY